MVVHLIPGGFFATLIPLLLRDLPQNLTDMLLPVAVALATLGYLGVSLTLLFRLRRAAVIFEILCTLGWWCGALFFWPSEMRLVIPSVFLWPIGMALIGVFHLLIANWLWRFRREEEE